MAKKRVAISKKTRFEVFKRDGFKCMYCGAHPPSVLLHVDHMTPVARDGKNDMDNLITACEPCNQGKGARELTAVPRSLADKASEVAEREEQLRGYQAILEARRMRLEKESWEVMFVLHPGENSVPREEMLSTKRFIEKLGYHEVIEAAEIAMAAPINYRKTFKYFCGICWNKLRKLEANPLDGIDVPWEKGGRG